MNKKIAKILDIDYKRLSIEEILLLKEYIINLQKENERLNDELKRLQDLLNSQAYKDLDNYKSRIDKAIEYIIENSEMYDEDLCTGVRFELRDLLNILQGSDKE